MINQQDIQVKRVHTTVAGGNMVGGGCRVGTAWGVYADDHEIARFDYDTQGELEAYRLAERLRISDHVGLVEHERLQFGRWLLQHAEECVPRGELPNCAIAGFMYNIISKLRGDRSKYIRNQHQDDELRAWGLGRLIP